MHADFIYFSSIAMETDKEEDMLLLMQSSVFVLSIKNLHLKLFYHFQFQDLKCNVCSSSFPTRNKLFGHIKESGHALRVEDNSVDSKGKKNKKKGKR